MDNGRVPMPSRRLALAVPLLLTFRASAQDAGAEATMTWLAADVSMGAGNPGQERTVVGPLFEHLISSWGGATRHRLVIANAKRSWGMLRAGENACHLMALHTPEREAMAYFVDTHLVPPLQLIVRAATLPRLPRNAAGEVDIWRLLRRTELQGAVVEGRSYGPALDQLLAQRAGSSQPKSYTPADFGHRLLEMMLLGRVDYIIDYDFALQQRKAMMPALQDLTPVPLMGHDEMLVSGIACPRTPWGARVVRRLAALLATPAGVQSLKASFDLELSPQARTRYGARIAAYYEQLPEALRRRAIN